MTACWIWVGSISKGIGRFSLNGEELTAKEAVYRLLVGGKHPRRLVPRCGQKLCVNPHHMEERQHDVPKS